MPRPAPVLAPVPQARTASPEALAVLRQVDLNLLRVLIEIHDAGGVSAACPRLHLSQPAVSGALARLRAALGDPLFVRTSRGLVATPYTERLLPAVRDTLGRLADALAPAAPFEPGRSARSFRIAMTDAGEMVFLPKLVGALAAVAPQLRLEIVPLAFEEIEDALGDGTLDLAVGPLTIRAGADLRVVALFRERYAGLVKAGGRLARAAGAGRRLPARALREARFAVVAQPSTRHRVILDTLTARGLEPNVIARVPHFVALPPLVEGHDALAVVPVEIASVFEERGLGVRVELPLPLPIYDVVLARHRRHDRDAGLSWLAAQVERALAKPRTSLPEPRAPAPRTRAPSPRRG